MMRKYVSLSQLTLMAVTAAATAQSSTYLYPGPEVSLPLPGGSDGFQCFAIDPNYPSDIYGVATNSDSEIYLWRWINGTWFSDPAIFDVGGTNAKPMSIAFGDFDAASGAGATTTPDFVAINQTAATAQFVLRDQVTGATNSTPISLGSSPRIAVVADFDNDGDEDVAVTNQGSSGTNGVSILLNNGSGAFTAGTSLTAGNNPYAIVAEDFDKDGNVDLAVTNYFDDDVSIFLGNGNGTFATQVRYGVGFASGLSIPVGISAADFDEDGYLDLTVATATDSAVSVLLADSANPGTFLTAATTNLTPTGSAVTATWIATGDLDGDGNVDMVTPTYRPLSPGPGNEGILFVCFGNGNGTFQTPQELSASGRPFYLEIADVNRDSYADLVISDESTTSGGIRVLFNNGPCNAADLALPFGTLDLDDNTAFINAFTGGCP